MIIIKLTTIIYLSHPLAKQKDGPGFETKHHGSWAMMALVNQLLFVGQGGVVPVVYYVPIRISNHDNDLQRILTI